MAKLRVEIETQDEQDLYKLLKHVFREITEKDYKNSKIDDNATIENGWLKIENNKYRWNKSN